MADVDQVTDSKQLHEVLVAGLALKLRSSHDIDTVTELTKLVDEKVREAQLTGQNISFQNALLLAALNIAEELVLLKRAARTDLDLLEKRAQDLLSNVESSPLSQLRIES